MNKTQLKKAQGLSIKGWSLRDIARDLGVSHESVRQALAAAPPLPVHMRPPPKPRRPKSIKAAASGTLLDVCRELLAELRRRARATSHPTLKTRFASDATNLAGVVLRLETAEATRLDGIAISRAEAANILADLHRRFAAEIARPQGAGRVVCTSCRAPLDGLWALGAQPGEAPTPPKPLERTADAHAQGVDGLLAEARAALTWLLTSTADAEAVGDEMSTQRAGRAAVSIAVFVARLEKAIAKTRTDLIDVPAAAVDNAHASIGERVNTIRNRASLKCARCSRSESVRLGTGLTEAELDAADAAQQTA